MKPSTYLFDVEITEVAPYGGSQLGDSLRFIGTTAQFMREYGLVLGDAPHRLSGHVNRNGKVLSWNRQQYQATP